MKILSFIFIVLLISCSKKEENHKNPNILIQDIIETTINESVEHQKFEKPNIEVESISKASLENFMKDPFLNKNTDFPIWDGYPDFNELYSVCL